jgi:5,5'-dehydrodivanillate O-demethylase
MLSKEMNERLTRVGPGTPLGNLLRRYWFPIARTPELVDEPVLAVTLLGENLALFRSDSGKLGLVAQRCPHRGASLAYGIPEEGGIRCAYHGWCFDRTGQCIDQPAEPADSTFKDRIQVPAYPVQELGGFVWAYLGPQPVPLLPRWDVLVRADLDRSIGVTHLPINFLQAMENSMDPIHFEWLHAVYGNYVNKRQGKPPSMTPRKHEQIAFDVFEYGIYKRRPRATDVADPGASRRHAYVALLVSHRDAGGGRPAAVQHPHLRCSIRAQERPPGRRDHQRTGHDGLGHPG